MANEKLLEIKNLTVHYQSYDATVHAVENLNLSLVIALGAGLAVWGVVNLMAGYGNDNPGANAHG